MDLTALVHFVADSFNHSAKARGETTATLACFATCTIVLIQPQREVASTVLVCVDHREYCGLQTQPLRRDAPPKEVKPDPRILGAYGSARPSGQPAEQCTHLGLGAQAAPFSVRKLRVQWLCWFGAARRNVSPNRSLPQITKLTSHLLMASKPAGTNSGLITGHHRTRQ